jgi:hypothetical protein
MKQNRNTRNVVVRFRKTMTIFLLALEEMFRGIRDAFVLLESAWFFVFPPILYFLFLQMWLGHAGGKYASGMRYVLLEIIPPRDVEKSPKLMESVFSGLAGSAKNFNTFETFVEGMFFAPFSLEIANKDGSAHMYVRTPVVFRNLVEANFFAQYPDMEIVEVPDYVQKVPSVMPNDRYELWGSDFELTKPDLYPIRTYKFFEEDVTGKMIDPLAGVMEVIGKLPPGQHLWIQWIISPEKDSWYKKGQETVDAFIGKAKPVKRSAFGAVLFDFVDVLRNLGKAVFSTPEFVTAKKDEKNEQPIEFRLSPGQKDVLKALESNLGKQMYRVKMRILYLGAREGFTKTFVSMITGALKQFSDNNLNGFKPESSSKTQADYLFVTERIRFLQRRIFDRYVARDPSPKQFLLSVEELASLFHPPDLSVVAPSLTRVAAKRGTAPSNLPISEE